LKIHANINNAIYALNVQKQPKFWRVLGYQGGGTRWQRQFLTGNRKMAILRMCNDKYAI